MLFCPLNVSAPPAACPRLKCSAAVFSAASDALLLARSSAFRCCALEHAPRKSATFVLSLIFAERSHSDRLRQAP